MPRSDQPYPTVQSVVVRPVKKDQGASTTLRAGYDRYNYKQYEVVSITPAEEILAFRGSYETAVRHALVLRGSLIRDFNMYPDAYLITKFREKISSIVYLRRGQWFDVRISRSDNKNTVVYARFSKESDAEKCVEYLAELVVSDEEVNKPQKSTVNLARFQRLYEDD